MSNDLNVAVVGATGAVGEALFEILGERSFPIGKLTALASERSAGKTIRCGKHSARVQILDEFDFDGVDIAFFSAGGSISKVHAPRAARAGAVVIDNTSEFRYDDDVPLVVPEINPHRIEDGIKRGIIANPNCSTIQMLVALHPIQQAVGIDRINVATYQAVSGAGSSGIRELAGQTAALLNGKPVETDVAPVQIAFNAIPQIDKFLDNGYTKEEMKMVWETAKIMEDDEIRVNPTCVRIPVFYGHSEAVHIETRAPITPAEALELLAQAPGVCVMDDHEPGGYPTAALNGAGTDAVYVGRVRQDFTHPNGLNMWVVSDNVRKGAALNSVQIGEQLLELL